MILYKAFSTHLSTLFVHLDTLDCHTTLVAFTPGVQPELLRLPKFFGCSRALICPRLVANLVWPVAVLQFTLLART